VGEYYRRNLFFFGLLAFFFMGVVRPPSFFFSHYFVYVLLADPLMLATVFGLVFLYWLKCMRYLWLVFAEPNHHFLHILPALPTKRLRMALLTVFMGVFAPAGFYLLVIVFHAVNLGTPMLVLPLLLFLVLSFFGLFILEKRVLRPSASAGTANWLARLNLRPPRSSMPMIYLLTLWQNHRNATWVTKATTTLLTTLLLIGHATSEVQPAMTAIAFLAIAALQTTMIWRLRQAEVQTLTWFRNLPFSWDRRLGHYLSTILLYSLPEIVLTLFFTLREGLDPTLLPHLLLAVSTLWLLGLAFTHLSQMRSQDYTMLVFSFFTAGFIAFLFKVPFWALYPGPLVIAVLIFRGLVFRSENDLTK
ncbi:MAG: hypothetical protein AAF570_03705, partial [Bacteroidota bacterium]